MKVYKVGLLLRHLYGYNSVCLFKPVNPLRLPGRLNLVTISSCFGNTHYLTQTEGRSVDEKRFQSTNGREDLLRTLNISLQGKAGESALSRAVYVSFYLNKIKDKQENQVAHTYKLIEAKFFMKATKRNKQNIDIIT